MEVGDLRKLVHSLKAQVSSLESTLTVLESALGNISGIVEPACPGGCGTPISEFTSCATMGNLDQYSCPTCRYVGGLYGE